MSIQILNNETTIEPVMLLEYEAEVASHNIIHSIIGKGDPDVSLADDSTKIGTLHLFFDTKADAWNAFNALRDVSVWTLNDTDHPEIDMDFTRRDRMKIRLDMVSRRRWIVEMDYQEII